SVATCIGVLGIGVVVSDPTQLIEKIRATLAPCRLGDWPTPLERAAALGGAVGIAELTVKREDRSSARYGGNKVRALEFLLAGARPGTVFVTLGGTGSTHCLATAVHAAAAGGPALLAQFPQPQTPASPAGASPCPARAAPGAPARRPAAARAPCSTAPRSPLPRHRGRVGGGLRPPDPGRGGGRTARIRARSHARSDLWREGIRSSPATWNVQRAAGRILAYVCRPCSP